MKNRVHQIFSAIVVLVGISAQATSIKINDFNVVNVNLNKEVFSFKNSWIFFNRSETTATLQVWNDICPKTPGQFSCLAEPILVLDGQFELSKPLKQEDPCGITVQRSDVVTVEHQRHQLVVRDFRKADKLNCLLADVDYAVELHSQKIGDSETRISYVDVRKAEWSKPEPLVKTYILDSSKYAGKFFKDNQPDQVTLSVDHTNLKAHLRMSQNPCGPAPNGINVCLAMPRVILVKTFDLAPEIVSMDKPFCNDQKYTSDKQDLDENVLAVVGAKRNRASVLIHDATEASCSEMKNKGFLSLDLLIENYADFGSFQIVNSKSKASLKFAPVSL